MTNKINGYSKVWNLGHVEVKDLFLSDVLVEEKIDGSAFYFAKIDGALFCRSHHQPIDMNNINKMFIKAVDTAKELCNVIREGWIYRGEYLQKNKHNTLCYNRTPIKNIIIYDIDAGGGQNYLSYEEKKAECDRIGLECVPMLFYGKIKSTDDLKKLIEKDSILGGQKVEGVVAKSYSSFGRDGKCLMAKLVNEKFKEIHRSSWAEKNPSQGNVIQKLGESLKTEARWIKAVQNLKETGEYKGDVADIGNLFKRVNKDIIEECSVQIKDVLFKAFWPKISKIVTSGLPQWYKDELLKEMKYEV